MSHAPTLDEVRNWPATVDISAACAALGISKSHGYAQAQAGNFPARVISVGRRWRVITADLLRLLGAEADAA